MRKTCIDKDLYSESSSLFFFFFFDRTAGQMKIQLLSYKSGSSDVLIL